MSKLWARVQAIFWALVLFVGAPGLGIYMLAAKRPVFEEQTNTLAWLLIMVPLVWVWLWAARLVQPLATWLPYAEQAGEWYGYAADALRWAPVLAAPTLVFWYTGATGLAVAWSAIAGVIYGSAATMQVIREHPAWLDHMHPADECNELVTALPRVYNSFDTPEDEAMLREAFRSGKRQRDGAPR